MKTIIPLMSQAFMFYLVVIMLSFYFTTISQAMELESGPSFRRATIIVNQPRSVLKTKIGLGDLKPELLKSSSYLSSSSLSSSEDEEEEKKITKHEIHVSPEVKAANEILNSPGFEDIRTARDRFHSLLQDVLTSFDPLPTLQRLSELAADMRDKHLLYEFLEKRERVKSVWKVAETKIHAAKAALVVYRRVVVEKAIDPLRELYEIDSQSFKDIKTIINKEYVPIYVRVVEPEPYNLFRARLEGTKLEKWWKLERDNFYDELLGAEAFLRALRVDLDDLKDRKQAILMDADFDKFSQKINVFVREKQQFLAQQENLRGRLRQVKVALWNYRIYSRMLKHWEESYEKDEAKFIVFKEQVQKMENNSPSTLFRIDKEVLCKAEVYHMNPERLPEILDKIVDLEVEYSLHFIRHTGYKPIHHIYDHLYKAKVQLQDYEVIRQKASACNEAFNKAQSLEKWSFEELKRTRGDFYRVWSPNIKFLRILETELPKLRMAAEQAGSAAWTKVVFNEATFFNSFKSLSLMVPQWTFSALADFYDQKYEIPHRRAYRDLFKRVEDYFTLASVTFNTVKTLHGRLKEGPYQAEYAKARDTLKIQLQQAKDFNRCIRNLQRFKKYWEAERDEKEAEAFKVDSEQFRNLNQQLNGLGEEATELLKMMAN
jgi:hypothetical protein